MSQIIRMVQGSAEWRAHRLAHRNASETAAVLGLSPWATPYQLWLQRTGRAEQAINAAMARGTELEAAARDAYEALTGLVMQPLVMIDGEYSASLDGITFDGAVALEIKCPMRGRASLLWQAVAQGEPPLHYYWQVQHQLMVSGAQLAHLYVFDGTHGCLLEQRPEPQCWPTIHQGWDAFMGYVAKDTPPALCAGDKLERTDEAWRQAAADFLRLKAAADDALKVADAAKAILIGLASHSTESGAGVTVTRYWKQGSVDYKQVPALVGVDLEQYRAKAREEFRVTVQR
jgi:putative phage-type endonuclease